MNRLILPFFIATLCSGVSGLQGRIYTVDFDQGIQGPYVPGSYDFDGTYDPDDFYVSGGSYDTLERGSVVAAYNLIDQVGSDTIEFTMVVEAQRYTNWKRTKTDSGEAWIFDSNTPTGGGLGGNNDGDPDLAAPSINQGSLGGGWPNNSNESPDNILIVQENTNSGAIPDDNGRGGILTFRFEDLKVNGVLATSLPSVAVDSISFIDIQDQQNVNRQSTITFFDALGGSVLKYPDFGDVDPNVSDTNWEYNEDRSYNELEFSPVIDGINYFVFDHKDSAAIASVSFSLDDSTITLVPEPSQIAGLALISLGGIVFLRRRLRNRRSSDS